MRSGLSMTAEIIMLSAIRDRRVAGTSPGVVSLECKRYTVVDAWQGLVGVGTGGGVWWAVVKCIPECIRLVVATETRGTRCWSVAIHCSPRRQQRTGLLQDIRNRL